MKLRNYFILFNLLLCAVMTAQSTRTWTPDEWWASLSGREALELAGVDPSQAALVPSHLNADGAIAWATIDGHLKSGQLALDTRRIVADIKAAKGSFTGEAVTTSASDERFEYSTFAWVEVPNTGRVYYPPVIHRKEDMGDSAAIGRLIDQHLNSLPPGKKYLRIFGRAMEVVPRTEVDPDATPGGRPRTRHPIYGGEATPQDLDPSGNYALPWYDDWVERVGPKLKATMQEFKNRGVTLDEIILDTEALVAEHFDIDDTVYNLIKRDSRWNVLKDELEYYGYNVDNVPAELNPFLKGAVGDIHRNQVGIWHGVQRLRWHQALNKAMEYIKEVFPNIRISDYDSVGFTGRHRRSHDWYFGVGWGTIGEVIGTHASVSNYNTSGQFSAPWGVTCPRYASKNSNRFTGGFGNSWDGLLRDIGKTRSHVASSNKPLNVWMAAKGFLKKWYEQGGQTADDIYWEESIFHSALSGQTVGYIWYNVEGFLGENQATQTQEINNVNEALDELSQKLGYKNQRPLNVEPVNYEGVNYIISGVDAGGKLTYRVSWDPNHITNPLEQIDWPEGVIEMDDNGIGAWVTYTPSSTAVPVASVTLDQLNIVLDVGSSQQLMAVVMPANATDKSVRWSIDNNSPHVTVDQNGLVRGVSQGTATVRVTTNNGPHTATATVEVRDTGVNPNLTVLRPTTDAFTRAGRWKDNNLLRVENGIRVAYLKYDLSGLEGTISSARLRFEVRGDDGFGDVKVHLGDHSNWSGSHNVTTSSDAPPAQSALLGEWTGRTFGLGEQVLTFNGDLSSIALGGQITLIVEQTSGNDFAFASRNLDMARSARLELDITPSTPNDDAFSPIADAYLEGTMLYGRNNLVRVGNGYHGPRSSYLKYDLSGLQGTVTSAKLRIRVTHDGGSGELEVRLGSHSNWTEDNLSNGNSPGGGTLLATRSGTFATGSEYEIVFTNPGALPLGSNVTLVLRQLSGDDFAFASREHSTLSAAELELDYAPSTPNDDDFSPIADAYLEGTMLYGRNNLVRVGNGYHGPRSSYLKYDLSGLQGTVTSAKLRIRVTHDGGSGELEVRLGSHSNWTEDNLSNGNSPVGGTLLATRSGTFATGSEYEIVFTNPGALPLGGNVTLVLRQLSGDDFAFASREHSTLSAAELELTYNGTSSTSLSIDPSLAGLELEAQDIVAGAVALAPNPTTGKSNLMGLAEGEKEIRVTDFSGKSLITVATKEREVELDLSFYPDGLYLVNIKQGEQERTLKIIKQ